MTRALVTQMLEALDESRGDVSQCLQEELPKAGYERYDRRIKAITEQLEKHDAAITAAREYLETEPNGERAELIERQRYVQEYGANPAMRALAKATVSILEADAQQATTPATEPNNERADLIADLRGLIDLHTWAHVVVSRAVSMLEDLK